MNTESVIEEIVEHIRTAEIELPSDGVHTLQQAYHVEEGIAKIQLETPAKHRIPFKRSDMDSYQYVALVNKRSDGMWEVISTDSTTINRMALFNDQIVKQFGIRLNIGKDERDIRTKKELQKYIFKYTYIGNAGVLAADSVRAVQQMYWLDKLVMATALWIFNVERSSPLIVVIDAHGASISRKE